jgi:hypothetical protein
MSTGRKRHCRKLLCLPSLDLAAADDIDQLLKSRWGRRHNQPSSSSSEEAKRRESYLHDNEISGSSTRCADVIGLRLWEPKVEGLALPKSVSNSNRSLNKLVSISLDDERRRFEEGAGSRPLAD